MDNIETKNTLLEKPIKDFTKDELLTLFLNVAPSNTYNYLSPTQYAKLRDYINAGRTHFDRFREKGIYPIRILLSGTADKNHPGYIKTDITLDYSDYIMSSRHKREAKNNKAPVSVNIDRITNHEKEKIAYGFYGYNTPDKIYDDLLWFCADLEEKTGIPFWLGKHTNGYLGGEEFTKSYSIRLFPNHNTHPDFGARFGN